MFFYNPFSFILTAEHQKINICFILNFYAQSDLSRPTGNKWGMQDFT